ncbi:MAG: DUF2500 domain-containing protein [Armatimonadota bacterium]
MDYVIPGIAILLGGLVLYLVIRLIAEAVANSRMPIEKFRATVVAKRTAVAGGGYNAAISVHTASTTRYFITFENEKGFRLELPVSGQEYGMMAEGDNGVIRFQGTWFKGFQRTVSTRQKT